MFDRCDVRLERDIEAVAQFGHRPYAGPGSLGTGAWLAGQVADRAGSAPEDDRRCQKSPKADRIRLSARSAILSVIALMSRGPIRLLLCATVSLALFGCPAPRVTESPDAQALMDPDAGVRPPSGKTTVSAPGFVPALGNTGNEVRNVRGRIPPPASHGTASNPERTVRSGISGSAN